MSKQDDDSSRGSLFSFQNGAMTFVVLLIIWSWLSFLSVVIFG